MVLQATVSYNYTENAFWLCYCNKKWNTLWCYNAIIGYIKQVFFFFSYSHGILFSSFMNFSLIFEKWLSFPSLGATASVVFSRKAGATIVVWGAVIASWRLSLDFILALRNCCRWKITGEILFLKIQDEFYLTATESHQKLHLLCTCSLNKYDFICAFIGVVSYNI